MKLEIRGKYLNEYYFGISEIAYIRRHGDAINIVFKNVFEPLNIDWNLVDPIAQNQLTKLIARLENRR